MVHTPPRFSVYTPKSDVPTREWQNNRYVNIFVDGVEVHEYQLVTNMDYYFELIVDPDTKLLVINYGESIENRLKELFIPPTAPDPTEQTLVKGRKGTKIRIKRTKQTKQTEQAKRTERMVVLEVPYGYKHNGKVYAKRINPKNISVPISGPNITSWRYRGDSKIKSFYSHKKIKQTVNRSLRRKWTVLMKKNDFDATPELASKHIHHIMRAMEN